MDLQIDIFLVRAGSVALPLKLLANYLIPKPGGRI